MRMGGREGVDAGWRRAPGRVTGGDAGQDQGEYLGEWIDVLAECTECQMGGEYCLQNI